MHISVKLLAVESFRIEKAFLFDSDAELFMYLIQCTRFGS